MKFKRGDVIVSYRFGGKMSDLVMVRGRNKDDYMISYWNPYAMTGSVFSSDIRQTEQLYDKLTEEELKFLKLMFMR